ncbi:hypothetical protein EDC02_4821 [Micromonospora sp. Llam0]|uniref:hypothetical protein n=1 Tax=Micromonospora sp. Llam0 TaxID=2485143 RepID=UPI000F4A3918|nr:hypothetical protein [Micromonospora sp. Llam0]ROO62826.1 hypothetical protein EDC02_4821 [Micromonospora sp. Llam0]
MTGNGAAGEWAEYVAAARRLARLRHGQARPTDDPAGDRRSADLTVLRDRLAAQRRQLVALGVPPEVLDPAPPEVAAVHAAVGASAGASVGAAIGMSASRTAGSPARQAAITRAHAQIDAVNGDLAVAAGPSGGPPPWLRNLLVYGPFAVIVLMIQLAMFVVAGDRAPLGYALGCGLVLPLVAFGLGWLAVGFVFAGPGQRPDRTPLVGALVCAVPLVLALVLAALISLLG